MKKNDYININYKKESKFNKMDIFEIDILGREVKFIEKEKSEAQLIPIKRRRRTPVAAQHPSSLPQNDLSLWLKADVGVSFFSFDYKSRLVLSGAVSGTFDATSVPTYNFGDSIPSDYALSNGTSTINWSTFEGNSFYIITASITLQGVTTVAGYFSTDGNIWQTFGNWTTPPSISGLTNDYSSGNGQYAFTETNPYDNNKVLDVDGNVSYSIIGSSGNWQLFYQNVDNSEYFQIASNSNDLPNGTWTMLVEEQGTAFGTGSAYATNPIPPTTVSSITSTVTTDSVTQWADQSASGRNAVNNNGFPVYNLVGGKSFLSFGSSTDMLVPSTIWSNVQFVGTIFVVARFASSTSGTTARLLYQEGVDGNFVFSRGYNNTNAFAITTDEVDFVSSSTNADNNTNYILGTTFSESNVATVYLNGIPNGTGGVTNNTGTYNTFVGGGGEPSSIAEMIVYTRVLTDTERLQVETYLNQKYQIY